MIVAMDTETQDGRAIVISKPNTFTEPRSWNDCMEFLCLTPQMGCWNADYDCQAVMKYLPHLVRHRLALLTTSIYGLYTIQYVKKKFMRVWYNDKRLFTIFDIQQFYNCNLKKAAISLGVTAKQEIPKSWYGKMEEMLHNPKTRRKLLSYAMGDAQTLQEIINRTVDAFHAAGLEFSNPYSNASFAQRVFKDEFRYKRYYKAEKAARASYHGGRIECLMAGYFRHAYYYDIHSAYPSAIADLVKPDGVWVHSTIIRSDATYAFIDCEMFIPYTERIGPIPIRRRSGTIVYPVGHLRKVITLTEYKYLRQRGWVKKIHNAVQHYWTSGEKPFKQIKTYYNKRKRYPAQSYALKIILNSTYGKLAQIMDKWYETDIVTGRSQLFDGRAFNITEQWKKHTSFVYAAEVTARIRIRLMREVPIENVIFFATDGVMLTKPAEISPNSIRGMKIGSGLGEWGGPEKVNDLIVVGSGVYQYRYRGEDGKEWEATTKFRGFSTGLNLMDCLKRTGRRKIVRLRVMRNTSLRQSIDRPRALNVLKEIPRLLDVNFDRKRIWPKVWSAIELTQKRFKSKPWRWYKGTTIPWNSPKPIRGK